MIPTIVRGRNNLGKINGLEDAIFDLKIGSDLGPRQFAGAWFIIKCLDRQSARTLPFDQVKEECRAGAMLVKGLPVNGKKMEGEFQQFQKDSLCQAFWPAYKEVVKLR